MTAYKTQTRIPPITIIVMVFFINVILLSNLSELYAARIPKVTKEEFSKLSIEKYPSELLSNDPDISENTLLKDRVIVPIFDVSYIAYRSKFAKANGYSLDKKYIDDTMSPELKAVEFTVKTYGRRALCGINLLVDKKLDIDFPEEEIIQKTLGGKKIRFPKWNYKKEGLEEKRFRINITQKYEAKRNMNVALATGDYSKTKNRGGIMSTSFKEFSPKYFKDENYISVKIGCSDLSRRKLRSKEPMVWLKKKEGKDYSDPSTYLKNDGRDRDEFYKLVLPKKAIRKILPVMEMTDGYNYFSKGLIRLIED